MAQALEAVAQTERLALEAQTAPGLELAACMRSQGLEAQVGQGACRVGVVRVAVVADQAVGLARQMRYRKVVGVEVAAALL